MDWVLSLLGVKSTDFSKYPGHPSDELNLARSAQLQAAGASRFHIVFHYILTDRAKTYNLHDPHSGKNPMGQCVVPSDTVPRAICALCDDHGVHYTQIARVRIGSAHFWVIFRTPETVDDYFLVPCDVWCYTDIHDSDDHSSSDCSEYDDDEGHESNGDVDLRGDPMLHKPVGTNGDHVSQDHPLLRGHVKLGDDPDLLPY
jgi:hypothetical protein